MKSFAPAAVLLASAQTVLGHAIWQQLWVDDVDQVSTCVRMPGSNSPITDVTSPDMACNAGTAGVAGMCAITAGQKVTVEMHQHASRACTEEAIGGAHRGPTIVYMAAVTDATTADPTTAKWFKVFEEGYNSATQEWADMTLNANCGKKDFIVPTDIAPGDYLIRAEQIALHAAGSSDGAQFYMSCYQVNVQGTGTAAPDGVSFPGAYAATDAGILINIYQTLDDYIIPGPELYGGGAAGGAPAGNGTKTETTPVDSTPAEPAEPVATPPTTVVDSTPAKTAESAEPVATYPTTVPDEVPSAPASSTTEPPSSPVETPAQVPAGGEEEKDEEKDEEEEEETCD
ncbi:uncharacterized protein L3040_007352 [Drepanopeziza brunnea f. sp. 'multigermtubi']|uniref:uncharacterized protein n=1 Tax=Drepanopeziza brunnea f. sp. 'multigermtubi' TaxID=698441 RepID=UPI00238B22CC|nr:hypothetical protein L3040_007352 [Drepanopeziza brunnea f. sp. 'multigermtubi']